MTKFDAHIKDCPECNKPFALCSEGMLIWQEEEEKMTEKELDAKIREVPLLKRLDICRGMICEMCYDGRPPRMSIPVRWNDEDLFIVTTIKDAIETIERLTTSPSEPLSRKEGEE